MDDENIVIPSAARDPCAAVEASMLSAVGIIVNIRQSPGNSILLLDRVKTFFIAKNICILDHVLLKPVTDHLAFTVTFDDIQTATLSPEFV